MNKLQTDTIEELRQQQLINETELRNKQIRAEFTELTKVKKIKVADATHQLAEKYFRSESSINVIVYSRKRKQKSK